MLRQLLREPLLHFLAIGFGFFVIFNAVSGDQRADRGNRIVVDRESLLTFMQYRFKNFQADSSGDPLNHLSADELQTIIDGYVREEALYREAKALNLDKSDYVSRRRLIGRLEFINQGLVSSAITLSEDDLVRYFDAHKDRYYVPPRFTFTHVFFSRERHGDDQAYVLAREELKVLNDTRVPFHGALAHGDRFLYHRNYVGKEASEITSHFGPDMQAALFAQEPDDRSWFGPVRSAYGHHLVMVTKRTDGYNPTLAEVRQRIEQDAARARLTAELDRINQSIVAQYDIQVADGLQRKASSAGETETRVR